VGLILVLRPRRKRHFLYWDKHEEQRQSGEPAQHESIPYKGSSVEDFIDVTSIFGGVKKNILSKNFKGGDIVSVFGGSEINLSQADFDQKVIIDAVQIFGGTKLIIPSHWQVRSEVVAIFGGIEDKRAQLTTSSPERILILKGFTMFGGLEIKSY
jgi:predicted membrane protein